MSGSNSHLSHHHAFHTAAITEKFTSTPFAILLIYSNNFSPMNRERRNISETAFVNTTRPSLLRLSLRKKRARKTMVEVHGCGNPGIQYITGLDPSSLLLHVTLNMLNYISTTHMTRLTLECPGMTS